MPTPAPSAVSVIIATLCEARRRTSLHRAIASVLAQEGVAVEILLIVNGNRYDPALLAELEARGDLRVHYRSEPGLPAALRFGRSLVKTEYFSFLDDDDEYLPGALSSRLGPMRDQSDIDVVVGNGLRGPDGCDPSGRETADDPLRELLVNNWLASCGALYRSASVDVGYFDDIPAYAEWTFLAYKLVLSRRVAFLDSLGHLIHDTERSTSKSAAYVVGQVAALERILELELPRDIRRELRIKYGAALHDTASHYAQVADVGNAWRAHLKSLAQPKGLRYVLYTRKLFAWKKAPSAVNAP